MMSGKRPPQKARRTRLRNVLSVISGLSVAAAETPGTSRPISTNLTIPDYVTRYAPLVWLHTEDPFRPSDLLKHLHHTTPMLGDQVVDPKTELNLDNLALLNSLGGRDVALTSNDDPTTFPAWLHGETPDAVGKVHNTTACVVIIVDKTPRDSDVYFFYFYSFDRGPNITSVVEPINRMIPGAGAYHYGNHVGDWEHNMIRFRDGKPTGIFYSQHRDGETFSWDDKALSKRDDRPVVFSAYGSHANYASEGEHIHDEVVLDYCDSGPLWDPILSAYFYSLDPNGLKFTLLSPSESSGLSVDSNSSFLYYTGIWGDAQYADDSPRQKTVPGFGLKRFVSGPTGPIDKQLLRKGMFPDFREPNSWVQWAVSVFMWWYPCCIRGWRKWMSLVVVVALVVSVVLGIRFVVRRYRRRGYMEIQTDIPMDELEGIDEGGSEDADDPKPFEAKQQSTSERGTVVRGRSE